MRIRFCFSLVNKKKQTKKLQKKNYILNKRLKVHGNSPLEKHQFSKRIISRKKNEETWFFNVKGGYTRKLEIFFLESFVVVKENILKCPL